MRRTDIDASTGSQEPVKATTFGYCLDGFCSSCPVTIHVQRKEGKDTYERRYICDCECHRNTSKEE